MTFVFPAVVRLALLIVGVLGFTGNDRAKEYTLCFLTYVFEMYIANTRLLIFQN